MNALQQLREEMSGAWESLTEGWHKLYRRATAAMTRFTTKRKDGGELTNDERGDIAVRSTGWGLLAAEVFDDDDRVRVRLEAPGMAKDDFQLEIRDDYLLVRGEKRIERERTSGHYHVAECAYGSFERAIPLPEEVDSGKASASYRNGVLRVELPKSGTHRRAIRVHVK